MTPKNGSITIRLTKPDGTVNELNDFIVVAPEISNEQLGAIVKDALNEAEKIAQIESECDEKEEPSELYVIEVKAIEPDGKVYEKNEFTVMSDSSDMLDDSCTEMLIAIFDNIAKGREVHLKDISKESYKQEA